MGGDSLTHPDSMDLVIALEGHRSEQALSFVEALEGLPFVYQIGLELLMCGGADLVRELVHQKQRVFLDFRLYDRPEVVARMVKQAALWHVDRVSVHLSGGSAMLRAIHDVFLEIPQLKPKVMGVGVLESFDDVRWAEVTRAMTGHASDRMTSVMGFLDQGLSKWVDGLICTLQEVSQVQKAYPSLYMLVSGPSLLNGRRLENGGLDFFLQAQKLKAHGVLFGPSFFQGLDLREAAENLVHQMGLGLSA